MIAAVPAGRAPRLAMTRSRLLSVHAGAAGLIGIILTAFLIAEILTTGKQQHTGDDEKVFHRGSLNGAMQIEEG
ncbi:hypothetical protein [Pseudomonas sp. PH1b]|uniref:hypothetical protein n=1 Tax=Pseudomonas sp. PH1b TaxID=1397282 RepID=UPI0004684D42|nr:hypothetical protein [Pseudomonas sp. PH1b]